VHSQCFHSCWRTTGGEKKVTLGGLRRRGGLGERLPRRGGVGERPRERWLLRGGGEPRRLRSGLRRRGGGGDLRPC